LRAASEAGLVQDKALAHSPPLGRREAVHYVYILQSEDGAHFYTGQTEDLRARFEKHNAGEVSHTAKFKPWRIKTYLGFTDVQQAIAFEKYLKSPSGRAFARKRL
jgi:putative endonuclease